MATENADQPGIPGPEGCSHKSERSLFIKIASCGLIKIALVVALTGVYLAVELYLSLTAVKEVSITVVPHILPNRGSTKYGIPFGEERELNGLYHSGLTLSTSCEQTSDNITVVLTQEEIQSKWVFEGINASLSTGSGINKAYSMIEFMYSVWVTGMLGSSFSYEVAVEETQDSSNIRDVCNGTFTIKEQSASISIKCLSKGSNGYYTVDYVAPDGVAGWVLGELKYKVVDIEKYQNQSFSCTINVANVKSCSIPIGFKKSSYRGVIILSSSEDCIITLTYNEGSRLLNFTVALPVGLIVAFCLLPTAIVLTAACCKKRQIQSSGLRTSIAESASTHTAYQSIQ